MIKIESEDYWTMLEKLLGEWIGEISGEPGEGSGIAKYEKTLQSKFIFYRIQVEFPPQEKNIDGEIHEDEGYFSYDKYNEQGSLRVFYVEGYVSTYHLVEFDKEKQKMTFEATEHENLPDGFRSKLLLHLESDSQLREEFRLASPGKDYNKCIINTWKKTS